MTHRPPSSIVSQVAVGLESGNRSCARHVCLLTSSTHTRAQHTHTHTHTLSLSHTLTHTTPTRVHTPASIHGTCKLHVSSNHWLSSYLPCPLSSISCSVRMPHDYLSTTRAGWGQCFGSLCRGGRRNRGQNSARLVGNTSTSNPTRPSLTLPESCCRSATATSKERLTRETGPHASFFWRSLQPVVVASRGQCNRSMSALDQPRRVGVAPIL